MLTYDEKGNTRYYEYGRYGTDRGRVRRRPVADLKVGPDGELTEESWEHLKERMKEELGKGKTPFLYCKDEADEKKIIEYAEDRMRDPNREPYSWNPFKPNTCATFAGAALKAGLKK